MIIVIRIAYVPTTQEIGETYEFVCKAAYELVKTVSYLKITVSIKLPLLTF